LSFSAACEAVLFQYQVMKELQGFREEIGYVLEVLDLNLPLPFVLPGSTSWNSVSAGSPTCGSYLTKRRVQDEL